MQPATCGFFFVLALGMAFLMGAITDPVLVETPLLFVCILITLLVSITLVVVHLITNQVKNLLSEDELNNLSRQVNANRNAFEALNTGLQHRLEVYRRELRFAHEALRRKNNALKHTREALRKQKFMRRILRTNHANPEP